VWLGAHAEQPLGGVVRPRRKVRFARFIHRRSRAFAPDSAGAASGGIRCRPYCHAWWTVEPRLGIPSQLSSAVSDGALAYRRGRGSHTQQPQPPVSRRPGCTSDVPCLAYQVGEGGSTGSAMMLIAS